MSGRTADLTADGRHYQLAVPAGVIERFVADDTTGLGWHAPVYGRLEPATTIRITATAETPFWTITVFGLDILNPVTAVEFLPLEAPASDAVGIRVFRDGSTDDLLLAEGPAGTRPARRRFGAVETDAHLYFCRTLHGQHTCSVVADLRMDTLCAA